MWLYPDNSRILELSTKCAPAEAFEVAAETRAFLNARGVDLGGEQETKTRKALEFFSAQLKKAGLKRAGFAPSAKKRRARKEAGMATRSNTWTGWIAFAGLLMVLIGGIDVFQGLIAIIRDNYYTVTPSQIIVFDTTTWGWITLLWGIVVLCAGFGLLSGAGWARWLTIVAASLNVFGQLGFVGSSAYPLWTLTGITLTLVVLYALFVHWGDVNRELV